MMEEIEGIEHIRLSDITPKKLEKIPDGVKIFDIESQKYFEKINGTFQEMIEEENLPEDESDKPIVPNSVAELDALVASGNKLAEVNTFMKLRSIYNELNGQKATINTKINFMFDGTPEQVDLIQARVSEVRKEALQTATFEQLQQFFIFDGEPIKLNFDPLLDEKEKIDAHREFLLYLKEVDDIVKDIDAHLKEIDELSEHFSEEVKTKSKDMYQWDRYIYELFKEKALDLNLTDAERERIKRIIQVKDEALSLAPIYTAVKAEIDLGRRRSMINAFQTRFKDTIKKAEQYAARNEFHVYFQLFDGVEEEFGYGEFRNLFAYLLARYIKYNANKLTKVDNAFIAQVTQNLIMLKKNQLPTDIRRKFVENIKEIEDLLIH